MSKGLRSRTLPVILVVGLAAGAGWWFMRGPTSPSQGLGSTGPSVSAPASSAAPSPLSASQVERGIANAQEAVQRDPKDAASWAMVAHSNEMLGRFDQAAEAYGKLLALRPQDAQVHADFADALGVVQRGSLQGEPARLIAKALVLDPANLKALVLGGKEAFERRQYGDAIAFWERALRATQDPAVRLPVETSIAEARALSSPNSAAAAAPASEAGLAFVSGRVTVAEPLLGRIGPDDAVFVYARPVEGSTMPVALLRKRGRDLPLDFALDDSLAMVPQSRLSQQDQVIVAVRVSKRGDAIPVSGDLEGQVGPVKLGATGLRLEITRARP
jgi:cytochrome c-type biogenesis protein CcmH